MGFLPHPALFIMYYLLCMCIFKWCKTIKYKIKKIQKAAVSILALILTDLPLVAT